MTTPTANPRAFISHHRTSDASIIGYLPRVCTVMLKFWIWILIIFQDLLPADELTACSVNVSKMSATRIGTSETTVFPMLAPVATEFGTREQLMVSIRFSMNSIDVSCQVFAVLKSPVACWLVTHEPRVVSSLVSCKQMLPGERLRGFACVTIILTVCSTG